MPEYDATKCRVQYATATGRRWICYMTSHTVYHVIYLGVIRYSYIYQSDFINISQSPTNSCFHFVHNLPQTITHFHRQSPTLRNTCGIMGKGLERRIHAVGVGGGSWIGDMGRSAPEVILVNILFRGRTWSESYVSSRIGRGHSARIASSLRTPLPPHTWIISYRINNTSVVI